MVYNKQRCAPEGKERRSWKGAALLKKGSTKESIPGKKRQKKVEKNLKKILTKISRMWYTKAPL